MWADASTWSKPDEQISQADWSKLDPPSNENRLDALIAQRKTMLQETEDMEKMPIKELLLRFKDLKKTIVALKQDLDAAEDTRKSILGNMDTVSNILLLKMDLTDEVTLQLIDKAKETTQQQIDALNIPRKRAIYERNRKLFTAIQELIRENQTEDMANSCGICYENTANHVITSCGHVLCGVCKEKVYRKGECHICRTAIRTIIQFYI